MNMQVVEFRTYRCMPGRLPDVVKRFREIVLPLWKEHEINTIGFWTTEIGVSNHELHYMIVWSSMAERELKWAKWMADPNWLAQRGATEANGPLVQSVQNQFLKPLDL